MPKKKTVKSSEPSKASGGQVAGSSKKVKTKTKKKQQQVTLATIPTEEELQCLMGELSDLIFKEVPKAEVSLLNDYVNSDFILIDGDSLFITCASDLTFQQGQNLHFFYLVECFLMDFTSKGAKCSIVFFTDAEHLYNENPYFLSLRSALIIHLTSNTNIAVQTEFSNCLDDSWLVFLGIAHPYLLIISNEGLNQPQTKFLHMFIIHALSRRINIVFTSGLECDAVRIYGYRIHGAHSHQQFFKQHKEKIELYMKSLLKHLQEFGTEVILSLLRCLCLEDEKRKILLKLCSFTKGKKYIRYIVCIVSCSLVLEKHSKELQSQSAFKQQKTALTLQEAADLIRMYCLSVAFLQHLPLLQRAWIRLINNDWNEEIWVLIRQHKLCEFLVLKHLTPEILRDMDVSALPDLSDNLLWKNIAHYYEVQNSSEFDLDRRSNICRDYEYLWSSISALSTGIDIGASFPLRQTSTCFLMKQCSPSGANASKMTVPNTGLVPMMCTVVDEFAGDILNDLPFLKSDDPAVTLLKNQRKVHERLHQYPRRPGIGAAKAVWTPQCFYGLSEAQNNSKPIDIELVNSKKTCTDVKKSKKNHKTKAEIIIEKNRKRKASEEIRKKEESQWDDISMSIDREIKENFKSGIDKLERVVNKFQDKSVKLTITMAGLNACFNKWKEHCSGKGKFKTQKNLNLAAEVMRKIHTLITNYQDLLKEVDYQQVVKCLRYLGFGNLIATSEHTKVPKDKREEFMKKSKCAVGIGSARFQLQYMSQHLMREERKDPDSRVQNFIPDTWQREILDIVDNDESAVIIAPPSSGKTCASYYCMEKILRDSDEGVVVYVAPTQALVNQVGATVQSLFNKTLPDGLTLCSAFTQGYHCPALNCQILVTRTQGLKVLLLSPHHQEWVKKIRYVIFDEVCFHGVDSRGEFGEHLLLMIQCPFLVLSAGVKNPEHLVEWLQSVKRYWRNHAKITEAQNLGFSDTVEKANNKKSGGKRSELYRVKLVVHEGNYNDLERYVCSIKEKDVTIHHYHPYAALTVENITKYGFPVDLFLSPRETVVLYDTMLKVKENWPRADELDPEEYIHFKDKTVITKADVRCYEEELKEELKMWIKHEHSWEANAVFKKLKPCTTCCSEKQMKDTFPHFVEKLQEMDKLPALFFLLSIKGARELADRMYCFLEEKQRDKQVTDPAKQEQLLAKRCGKIEKSVKSKQPDDMKLSCKNDKILVSKDTMKQLEKISEIPADCTYSNVQAIDIKSLHKIFDHVSLVAKYEDLQKLALRGIGYHHASMELKERQFVEILFKTGFIQVVTATGGLGLGINTPCKSVVFVQNSDYLDDLNYRWMSGRAGQRGHHFLGNVYFYNIPMPKIEKLVRSNIPEIHGQFILRISLILRLMLFASKAEDKVDARATVVSLMKNSLLSFEQPKTLNVLKLYFFFTLQFLLKERYVDQEGNSMQFPELVTRLHFHEPSNFVFAYLLHKGLFYKLCQPSHKGSNLFSKDVMEKLVLVLAHLFGRKYMVAAAVKSKQKFSQSKVFLEDLPEDFAAALVMYNYKVAENYGQFLLTVPRLANITERCLLPLSKLDFSNTEQPDSPLVSCIMSCKERMAVSPFVCLSGNSDLDLLHTGTINSVLLHTLGITAATIPVLYSKKCDKQGRRMLLNAYVLDFYKHGSLAAMTQDNGLNEGEAYRLLKDFAFAVKTISVSLCEFYDSEDHNVVRAFEQLSRSYWEKLEKIRD